VLIVALAAWMIWRVRREQIEHDHHEHHHDGDEHGHAHRQDHVHYDHVHDHHHPHEHDHRHDDEAEEEGLEIATGGYMDAHEREHAEDIRRRFASRTVTTGQIVLFGLTGGLIPCPGAITVLLLCLQLHRVALGAVLVLCFSIGLAMTMVASGVVAAISVRHVSKRWSGFGEMVRKAPYVSAAVILLIGLYVAVHGFLSLPH